MIICGTGHRPEDCEDEEIVREKSRLALQESRPDGFITGMAAGLDLWAGHEAHLLGIPIWCARPWKGHAPREGDVELYALLISVAERVIAVSPLTKYPGPWVYHKRNEWMVDHADEVLAYWSGKESGGTYACLNYAIKMERPITNVF